MDCKKIQQVIYRFIYGESNTFELRKIKAHLERCQGCEKERLIIEDILVQLRFDATECNEPCPDGMKERLLDRIKRDATGSATEPAGQP
jgi:hypothetical protein